MIKKKLIRKVLPAPLPEEKVPVPDFVVEVDAPEEFPAPKEKVPAPKEEVPQEDSEEDSQEDSDDEDYHPVPPQFFTSLEEELPKGEVLLVIRKSEYEAMKQRIEELEGAKTAKKFVPKKEYKYKYEIHEDHEVKVCKRKEDDADDKVNKRREYQRERYRMIYAKKNEEERRKK